MKHRLLLASSEDTGVMVVKRIDLGVVEYRTNKPTLITSDLDNIYKIDGKNSAYFKTEIINHQPKHLFNKSSTSRSILNEQEIGEIFITISYTNFHSGKSETLQKKVEIFSPRRGNLN